MMEYLIWTVLLSDRNLIRKPILIITVIQVAYDLSDVGVTYLHITEGRHAMVDFSVPILPAEEFWMSNAPIPLHPYKNLLMIFDPPGWCLLAVSLVAISLSLLLFVRVGRSYGIVQPETITVLFIPLGMINAEAMPGWFDKKLMDRDITGDINDLFIISQFHIHSTSPY